MFNRRFPKSRRAIAIVGLHLLVVVGLATAAHAAQTISTAVTGPQYGDGGTFTITSAGSVTNNAGDAVTSTSTSGQLITTFVNDGATLANNYALFNDATSMTGITNSGTMSGLAGLFSTGTIGAVTNQSTGSISAYDYPVIVTGLGSGIGSLTNSGAIVNTGGGGAIAANDQSVIGTLTNTVSGSIAGGYNHGISVSNSLLGTLNNAGSITGPDRGIFVYRDVLVPGASASITTLTNSGTTSGGLTGIMVEGGTIGSLTNSAGGLIDGSVNYGLQNYYSTVTTLDNFGTIQGGWVGVRNEYQTIGTITNRATGMIQGTAYDGIQNVDGTITTIDNFGVVNGLNRTGIRNEVSGGNPHIDTITNRAGAIVSGAESGISNSGNTATINLIDNSGTVTGGTYGVFSDGTLSTLTNSGTTSGGITGITVEGGTIGSLTNSAGGLIDGSGYYGLRNYNGTVTTLDNFGTIQGGWIGVRNEYQTIGTITNRATGMIQGTTYDGIQNVDGTITTIDNFGVVNGVNRSGIRNEVSGGTPQIGTITNRAGATVSGTESGISNSGNTATINLIDNSGTVTGGTYGVFSDGTLSTLTNAGTVTGGSYGVSSAGTLSTLTNSGTVSGGAWGAQLANTGTITNTATGLISGTSLLGLDLYGTNGTVTNAGRIEGGSAGLQAGGDTTSLTNSGTISGGSTGIYKNGTVGTLTNSATGVIEGTSDGIYTGNFDDAGAIVNAGQITGGRSGIYAYYGFGDLTNQTGGTISGTTGAGVYVEDAAGTLTNEAGGLIVSAGSAGVFVGNYDAAILTSLTNAGTIEGVTAGVEVGNSNGGQIDLLTNSGTIRFTGSGSGPALLVVQGGTVGQVANTGSIGDVTNAGTIGDGSGTAISSTGVGASIGEIFNQGTISGGFTIENQDVTVSADGGLGRFTSGTLNVVSGNLTFTSGTTTLDAAISVNGGTGTVFNDATLRLLGIENVTGNYQQNAGGVTLMDLLGTSSGQYGQLNATGSASFAGGLALSDAGLAGGLADGQTFQLFGFGSYTGGFGSLSVNGTSLQSLGGGDWLYGTLKLTEQWTGTTMSLAVSYSGVPEIDPASMASVLSLVVGSLGLAERRLRRRSGRTG
jgi:hypothetical protein